MKNQYFDEYFYLKKSERRGVLLFFICSVSCVILFKIISGSTLQITVQNKGSLTEIADTLAKISNAPNFKYRQKKEIKGQLKKVPLTFNFNPNTLSQDSLKLLGFSDFCASNIIKYRKKGGQFRNVQQMAKIFGMDTSRLAALKSSIRFHEEVLDQVKNDPIYSESGSKQGLSFSVSESLVQVDVNQADSSALVSIKGIGPYYAKKIIAFRKKIGGISRPDQLLECNIIPDSTWVKIAKNFIALPNEALKININKAGYRELIQHPYLEENLVKVILLYRKNHGDFTNPHQLKNIKILTPEVYEKIIPHFSF